MNQLTETQKAYIAGFIDGEGSIGIRIVRDKKWKRAYYSVSVNVYSSDSVILYALHQWTGVGEVYGGKRNNRPAHHKPTFIWRFGGKTAQELLKAVLPYLQIKRRQAELAIGFPTDGHVSENKEAQEAVREAIMILNQGGVK